jgi:hypothetical protein
MPGVRVRARLLAASRLGFAAALATALLAHALERPARGADPRLGFREPTSVVDAFSVSPRLDANNANFSGISLPRAASVTFQARVAPPITGEPVADGAGGLLVAHGRDRVSALDAKGRSLWSVRLGSELASGPLPFGAGKYLLVARDGRLFELSDAGAVTERPALPWNDFDGAVLYAPTSEGGAIVANAARVARVAPSGTRGFQTKLKSLVRAVFDWRGATLAVGRDGSIWLRGTAGDTQKLGSFDAPLVQALLVGDRVLGLAEHELLSVELSTKQTSVVWAEPALELHDIASAGGRRTLLLAGRSLLIGLDESGHEVGRFPLLGGESGTEISGLVVDRSGASFALASGAALLFVSPEGDATSVAGTGCPDPVRVTPVAPNRLVAACRSGLLRWLSDKAR